MSEGTNITAMDPVVLEMKLKEYELMKKKEGEKKAKQAAYNERRRVWMNLMIDKAAKANITVTDEEVLAELKKIKKS